MKHLILFFHADPQVKPKYLDKLSGIPGVELRFINAGGYSSAYQQYAMRMKDKDGCIMPRLVFQETGKEIDEWNSVSLVSFSAGYALAREILKNPSDRADVEAYVAIDSIHDDLKYSKSSVWVDIAKEAAAGNFLFWIGHTDVQTPQSGTGAFASTTQVAKWLVDKVPQGKNFLVRSYNLEKDPRAEHISALNVWGPSFVAEALVPWLGGSVSLTDPPKTNMTSMPEWLNPDLPYGERCVLLSLSELASNVRETTPGSNTSPRIKEYLAGCTRNGSPLNLQAGAWCAAAACWVAERCRQRGETPPHLWRCSGLEMEQDAMRTHCWVDIELVRNGGVTLDVGDIAMFSRGTPSWQRHVTRILSVPKPDGTFRTIGGNENDRWQITDRKLSDKELLGFIRYPVPNG